MQSSQQTKFIHTYRMRMSVAILTCTLIAALMLAIAFKIDVKTAESNFRDRTEAAYAQLQNKINDSQAVISALSGWHRSHIEKSHSEFSIFTRAMLANHPHVYSIQYLRKVNEQERPAFETQMREEGYAAFNILDRTGEADFIPAKMRQLYFPLTFVEPLEPANSHLIGVDFSSDAELAKSIRAAIESGETVSSKPVTLFAGKPMFILFKAVYKGNIVPEDIKERIEHVDGLFAVVVSPEMLQSYVLDSLDATTTSVTLYHSSFDKYDVAGHLLNYNAPSHSDRFEWLLPEFRQVVDMNSIGRPLIIEFCRDMSLSDINPALPTAIFLAYLATILFIRHSLKGDLKHSIATEISKDELFREKERAEVTLYSIADGVITTDNNNRIEHMNEVAQKLTGWRNGSATGELLGTVFLTYDQENGRPETAILEDETLEHAAAGIRREFLLRSNDGHEYAIKCSVARIRDRSDEVMGSVIVFRDVSTEQAMAMQLAYQARHDELTGLYNRREFELQLGRSLERVRQGGKADVLCYLDLDQFKVVNDTCGHIAGDELLRQVTHLLRENIRDSDLLARLGGDEFGLIMLGCSIEKAKEIAAVLHQLIREYRFVWQGKTFDIGASMGLVEITPEIGSIHEVMSAADSACYVAKDKGRNRIFAYTLNDSELMNRQGEMQWVHKIHEAFANSRFVLYRQQVVPLNHEQAPIHYEVLLRMRDDNGGAVVLPMAFIPAAERYNIMSDVDRWVVKNALAMMSMEHDGRVVYNLNLSGKSLNDENFLAFVVSEIESSGVDTQRICFEITETAAIANLSSARSFMNSLRKMGCSFALDDFGSGLSSFAYLKNLPVDYLKIDGSFVKDMIDDPVDLAMVTCIAQVGRVMGIKTIAESVENESIKNQLKLIGVDYAQGYGVAFPEEWLINEQPASLAGCPDAVAPACKSA
ncbi:MAG: EAL domain-containing protein [Gammaproteobacteria bacterium]